MIQTLIQSIEGTAINQFVLGTSWLWPLMEILHFVGLTLLLGALLIVDLRLAGFLRQMNINSTHRLLPWAIGGFGLNLVTGVLFFMGDPSRYAVNIGFQVKMLLILVAGLNALWFYFKLRPVMADWDPYGDTPAIAKVIAYLSLSTWFGVLLLGRLIPYIGTG